MWDVLHLIDTLVQTNQGVMHYDDQMVLKEIGDAVRYLRELKIINDRLP